jgi:hypothetical protein
LRLLAAERGFLCGECGGVVVICMAERGACAVGENAPGFEVYFGRRRGIGWKVRAVWSVCDGIGILLFAQDDSKQEQATTKVKYRGLSTAQQTMELSVASVEMTFL